MGSVSSRRSGCGARNVSGGSRSERSVIVSTRSVSTSCNGDDIGNGAEHKSSRGMSNGTRHLTIST